MNSKLPIVLAVCGVVLLGGLFFVFSQEAPSRPPGPHVEVQPHDPMIEEKAEVTRLSIGFYAQGYTRNISNIRIIALNEDCEQISVFDFGRPTHADLTSSDPRKTKTVTDLPKYIVPDIPDQDSIYGSGWYVINGLKRVSDKPVNNSYRWEEYEISDPQNDSELCP